jgi:UDP-glucose 4-epimerase
VKVLVTGGAGFIGSHVCDALLEGGHEVVALDNLSSGRRENLHPKVKLVVEDIRTPGAAACVERERPQALFHLAAQMDVRRSVEDPRFDAEANILGFLNLLEASRRSGVKKVIFSSTGGAIYGEQDVFPAPETHPTRPISPYGVSKASGELYLGYFKAQYGLSYTALRYANVYGPRQNPHGEAGVVAIFSQKLVRGEPCTISGQGLQTRDFVYCKDVARANVLALSSDYVGPLNVGTGREVNINELYRLMAEAAGVKAPAQHSPPRAGEQLRSCIDAALAKKVLGWAPAVKLEDGLRETVAFFQAQAGRSLAHG